MYIVCLILFVGGIILMGLSFSLAPFQALFFMLGLLAVCAALAIPIHASRHSLRK
ncbi:hypothetical protein [Microbacterium rhizosphaerae]|jgi:hypothetical protein|uniref:DUF1328 domain-containing protein n=1 Tax=Microbacterium rhizosphaerae TaxID=1678237 RepID=A0ABZ0SQY8_9MICO|nr:hypothetical protein [Microbacterium rhizosphaerae]WPR90575.1 hypothetical protein SM116_04580 [Microbacterium rhizosphaerae]